MPEECYITKLPTELLLAINKRLCLRDRLSLVDTCRAFRPLVTEAECIEACTKAGLSQVPGMDARTMTKLLSQPRVGMCNWSYEDGQPKANLDFSKLWSISSAIRSNQAVDLHPTFLPAGHMFLRDTQSFEHVRLHVAPDMPDIRLCEHRLYMHEFATSPPLTELRILIKEDEGPIREGYVAFRIQNPSGVTLGNYYQGLFEFLHQAPYPDMHLTDMVLRTYILNRSFERDCPTNLAMLDRWCEKFGEDILFSDKSLTCSLPLRKGELKMVIFAEDPQTETNSPQYLDAAEWGLPQRQTFFFGDLRQDAKKNDVFWKEAAPVIRFGVSMAAEALPENTGFLSTISRYLFS